MFLFRDYKFKPVKELRNVLMLISSVGWHKALIVSWKCGIAYPFFMGNLTPYLWKSMFFILNKIACNETSLIRYTKDQIIFLVNLNCYRGQRHQTFLPVRGQRTRTNAGTQRAFGAKWKENIFNIWT